LSKQTTILYRAVSHAEFEQIRRTGALEIGPNGLGGKFFAETVEHAERWGELLEGEGGFRVVSIQISNAIVGRLMRWENLDNIGPAIYIEMEDLRGIVSQTVK